MKRVLLGSGLLLLLALLFSQGNYPVPGAYGVDSVFVHGTVYTDNHAWLKDRQNPRVIRHLKKENRYAAKLLKPSCKIASQVYLECLGRIQETETTYPYFYKGYHYYTRMAKGKPYALHCRKKGSLTAAEEIILDENKLAGGKKYFALGSMDISPNQQFIAYSVDFKGDENYRLYIKEIASGKTRKTAFGNVSEALWMADNRTLILSTLNARLQTDKVWRFDTASKTPVELYNEADPGWDVSLYANCDETMIFLCSSSKDATEVYYLHRDNYTDKFSLILPRKSKHIYYPDYYDGKFYFRTNLWQQDYDIAVCPLDNTGEENWLILYRGKDKSPLLGFSIFKKNLAILKRENGFKSFVFAERESGKLLHTFTPRYIDYPSDLSFWINPNPEASDFYFTLENDVTPLTIYRYSFSTARLEKVHQYLPAGSFNTQGYYTEMRLVPVADSIFIPLRLTYSIERHIRGDVMPLPVVVLNAYGAYGDCSDPYFSSANLSLLDRNIVLATAHIRGGGEYGQYWYDSGRMLNKQNSIDDFIACMDYLLQNFTTAEKLVIQGGSAGGLLIGAVVNKAYDKCALAIADVPFVDLVCTMLDESLPLTLQEYEEWGNPYQKEYFDYMLSFSPVDNVKPHPYPAMLITTALNDTRVGYWEAVKWVDKLRTYNTGSNPIILKVNMDEGHTGQADRYKSLQNYSETLGYILYRMNIQP